MNDLDATWHSVLVMKPTYHTILQQGNNRDIKLTINWTSPFLSSSFLCVLTPVETSINQNKRQKNLCGDIEKRNHFTLWITI